VARGGGRHETHLWGQGWRRVWLGLYPRTCDLEAANVIALCVGRNGRRLRLLSIVRLGFWCARWIVGVNNLGSRSSIHSSKILLDLIVQLAHVSLARFEPKGNLLVSLIVAQILVDDDGGRSCSTGSVSVAMALFRVSKIVLPSDDTKRVILWSSKPDAFHKLLSFWSRRPPVSLRHHSDGAFALRHQERMDHHSRRMERLESTEKQ
jgi:hypothetical protein